MLPLVLLAAAGAVDDPKPLGAAPGVPLPRLITVAADGTLAERYAWPLVVKSFSHALYFMYA